MAYAEVSQLHPSGTDKTQERTEKAGDDGAR
jgi:hypothetical protein